MDHGVCSGLTDCQIMATSTTKRWCGVSDYARYPPGSASYPPAINPNGDYAGVVSSYGGKNPITAALYDGESASDALIEIMMQWWIPMIGILTFASMIVAFIYCCGLCCDCCRNKALGCPCCQCAGPYFKDRKRENHLKLMEKWKFWTHTGVALLGSVLLLVFSSTFAAQTGKSAASAEQFFCSTGLGLYNMQFGVDNSTGGTAWRGFEYFPIALDELGQEFWPEEGPVAEDLRSLASNTTVAMEDSFDSLTTLVKTRTEPQMLQFNKAFPYGDGEQSMLSVSYVLQALNNDFFDQKIGSSMEQVKYLEETTFNETSHDGTLGDVVVSIDEIKIEVHKALNSAAMMQWLKPASTMDQSQEYIGQGMTYIWYYMTGLCCLYALLAAWGLATAGAHMYYFIKEGEEEPKVKTMERSLAWGTACTGFVVGVIFYSVLFLMIYHFSALSCHSLLDDLIKDENWDRLPASNSNIGPVCLSPSGSGDIYEAVGAKPEYEEMEAILGDWRLRTEDEFTAARDETTFTDREKELWSEALDDAWAVTADIVQVNECQEVAAAPRAAFYGTLSQETRTTPSTLAGINAFQQALDAHRQLLLDDMFKDLDQELLLAQVPETPPEELHGLDALVEEIQRLANQLVDLLTNPEDCTAPQLCLQGCDEDSTIGTKVVRINSTSDVDLSEIPAADEFKTCLEENAGIVNRNQKTFFLQYGVGIFWAVQKNRMLSSEIDEGSPYFVCQSGQCTNEVYFNELKELEQPVLDVETQLLEALGDSEVGTLNVIDGIMPSVDEKTIEDFDCKFAGKTIDESLGQGCRDLPYSSKLTGIFIIMAWVGGCIQLWASWRAWHYWRDRRYMTGDEEEGDKLAEDQEGTELAEAERSGTMGSQNSLKNEALPEIQEMTQPEE